MQSNNQSNLPFYQNKTNNQNPSPKDEKRISKFVKKVSFCANAIDDMVQNSSSFEDSYNYLYRFTKKQLIKFDNTLTNNLSKNDCIVIICKKYRFKAPKDFIFNIDADVEENIENLTNSQLDDLYSTVYDSLGEAIENDDSELHNEILPDPRVRGILL